MDRLHHSPACDRESEAITEQPHEAAEGQPALFIQDDGEGDGLRAQLHGRGTERVRGLQRVPSLHAAVTLPTLPDGHAKLVHDWPLHGEIFVILRDDVAPLDRAAAVRAVGRQRDVMRHVHTRRRPPMRLRAVGGSCLAARPIGMFRGEPTRERRGLPIGPTARHLEFLFQPLVFPSQPVALDLRAPHVLAESFVLATEFLDDLVGIRGGESGGRRGTAALCQIHRSSTRENSVPQCLGVS
jgi:hypothetical protein